MLLPADAALVERDPTVGGLATLLDVGAFTLLLQARLPQVAIDTVTARYVRYKPATSCLVAYDLVAAGKPLMVYARAVAPASRNKLDYARRLADHPGPLGPGGLVSDEDAIAVYSFPYDYALPALLRLDRRRRRTRLLGELCPARDDLQTVDLETLRYRPERRYVGRLRGAFAGDAVLKLYSAEEYARARLAAAAFVRSGPLQVARILGFSDRHRALLFPWLPGTPLSSMLWQPDWQPAALYATGAALAALHHQPAPQLPFEDRAVTAATLTAAAHAVALLCPPLGERANRLAASISTELQSWPPQVAALHGDFYADQVLINAEQATLLDLDNAACGDPAADLGNFSAHLQRAVIVGCGTVRQAAALTNALWAGYAARGRLPAVRQIALYQAAGLLRLAVEPFRYRVVDWPTQMAALLAAAEQSIAAEVVVEETL